MSPLGVVAAVLGVSAWGPAIARAVRTRSAADLSWWFLAEQTASVFLWVYYGWYEDEALFSMQVVNAVLLVTLGLAKLWADRRCPLWVPVYVATLPVVGLSLHRMPLAVVGGSAGAIGVSSWLAQVARTWRTMSSHDLSYPWLLLVLAAAGCWTVQGLHDRALPLALSQAAVVTLVLVLIILALQHRRRARRAVVASDRR